VDTGFPKTSCLSKKIERDDDSKKSHLALTRFSRRSWVKRAAAARRRRPQQICQQFDHMLSAKTIHYAKSGVVHFAYQVFGSRPIGFVPGWISHLDVAERTEEFRTCSKSSASFDRVLATIVFTDVVASGAAANEGGIVSRNFRRSVPLS
jgi:hypothetical protein